VLGTNLPANLVSGTSDLVADLLANALLAVWLHLVVNLWNDCQCGESQWEDTDEDSLSPMSLRPRSDMFAELIVWLFGW